MSPGKARRGVKRTATYLRDRKAAGDKLTVGGARGTHNIYLLDGVSNSDLSGNAQGASGAMSWTMLTVRT